MIKRNYSILSLALLITLFSQTLHGGFFDSIGKLVSGIFGKRTAEISPTVVETPPTTDQTSTIAVATPAVADSAIAPVAPPTPAVAVQGATANTPMVQEEQPIPLEEKNISENTPKKNNTNRSMNNSKKKQNKKKGKETPAKEKVHEVNAHQDNSHNKERFNTRTREVYKKSNEKQTKTNGRKK